MDKISYNIVKNLAILIALPILFTACNSELYSQFCTDKKAKIGCLKLESLDDEVLQIMQSDFNEIVKNEICEFTLQGMYYHIDACQNPVANSVGSDFDGYVKLQIFHKGTCYYRIQTDYKGRGWKSHMSEISKQLKVDNLLQ